MAKKDWPRVSFGDVVQQVRDRVDPETAGIERYVAGEHMDSDDLRIRRWGLVGNGYLGPAFHMRFKPGHVLYGSRRTYLRKVAVADFEGVTANTTFVLEPKTPGVLLPDLLPFIMQTEAFHEHSLKQSKGSVNPYINYSDLAWYEFALPPLEEQRRISNVLAAHKELRESLLEVSGAGTRSEYALLKETFGEEYNSRPPNLDLVPLSEMAEVRTGLAKGRMADDKTTTRPYLRVANVLDGALDLRDMKEIVVERDKIPRYSLQHGDVLMTEGGDLDKLGRGTVWQGEIDQCLHQNHVFAVRPNLAVLEPWFLAAAARSPYGRSFFLQSAKRTSNLASVNKKQVSSFLVPLMPLRKQRAWLEVYHSVRGSVGALRDRIDQVGALGKRMLEQSLGR